MRHAVSRNDARPTLPGGPASTAFVGVIVLILSLAGALSSAAADAPAVRGDSTGTLKTVTIGATASSSTIVNGQKVLVQYTVTSEGEPIAGARTEVQYGGRTTVVTVDNNGQSSMAISDLPVGAAKVIIRYTGDALHAAASTFLAFSVAARSAKITALTTSVNSVAAGKPVVLRYLVTSQGTPLANARTAITYGSKTMWARSGADGRVALNITDLRAGRATILVRYFGDVVTGRASASTTVMVSNLCPAYAKACVDLANSVSWLQEGGAVIYGPVPITSGRPGLRTRPGTYRAYWKSKNHVSSIYGTPMPNSIFFDGGIAFHEGSLTVTSHGCVHLSMAASEVYWNKIRSGDKIYVWGTAPY
ncbi:MAG: L,D-transpeptidase family protein [Nakamurella sp.]